MTIRNASVATAVELIIRERLRISIYGRFGYIYIRILILSSQKDYTYLGSPSITISPSDFKCVTFRNLFFFRCARKTPKDFK